MNRELRIHVPGPLGGFTLIVAMPDMFQAQAAFDYLTGKGIRVDSVTYTEQVQRGGFTPATVAEHNGVCPFPMAAGTTDPCPACEWEPPREIPVRPRKPGLGGVLSHLDAP